MEKKYKITKEECQSQIDVRMPVVCSGCGGKIEPIDTVDNSDAPTYWPGCLKCFAFDYGSKPEIYQTAEKMVDEHGFRAYSYDNQPDKETELELFNYWRSGQIRGACVTVRQILKVYESVTP